MNVVQFRKLLPSLSDALWARRRTTRRRPSQSRGLVFESLETRALLAIDVAFRLDVTDLAGAPINTVEVGDSFYLNAYVQDVREGIDPSDGGLFSAYMDVDYDTSRVSVDLKETQRIDISGAPTGGTFTLTFDGETTTALSRTASAADVEQALEALSNLEPDDVEVVDASTEHWTVRFGGAWVNQNVPELVGDGSGLLGGTNPLVTVSQATGVNPANFHDVTASTNFGSDYPDRQRGTVDLDEPDTGLDEMGAARLTTGTIGTSERLLFQVQMTADTAGTVTFEANYPDEIDNEIHIINVSETIMDGQIDFGSVVLEVLGPTTSTVGDRVWLDSNLDGLQNPGEPGVQGVHVEVFSTGANNQIGGGDDVSAGSATTDVDGMYEIGNLGPGNYYLTFTGLPAGFGFTLANVGSDDADDSDVDPQTGRTGIFTIGTQETNLTIDAGIVPAESDATARFDVSIVLDPTATDANGQIDALPDSETWMHEWNRHWVEIWVSTPDSTDQAVTAAAVNFQYDTDLFTATSVVAGSAFGGGLTPAIDDATGTVELVGVVTVGETVGADKLVLLARIEMQATSGDSGLPIDLDEAAPISAADGPWVQLVDDGTAFADVGSVPAGVQLGPPPSTALYPVLYDLDDDGLIGFGDLSILSSVFLKNVNTSSLAYKSDFNRSDLVDFGDFSLLTANFLKGRASGNSLVMPLDFPVGFDTAGTAASSSAASTPPRSANALAADVPTVDVPATDVLSIGDAPFGDATSQNSVSSESTGVSAAVADYVFAETGGMNRPAPKSFAYAMNRTGTATDASSELLQLLEIRRSSLLSSDDLARHELVPPFHLLDNRIEDPHTGTGISNNDELSSTSRFSRLHSIEHDALDDDFEAHTLAALDAFFGKYAP